MRTHHDRIDVEDANPLYLMGFFCFAFIVVITTSMRKFMR